MTVDIQTQPVAHARPFPVRFYLTRTRVVVFALFAGLALVNLYFLLTAPSVFVDEGWNASRSWALLHTGKAFGTLDAGVMDNYPDYWYYFPWLGTAIHSVFLAVFGPTLFAMRLTSLLFGTTLLAAVYYCATRLYNSTVGIVAVLFTGLSIPYLYTSHVARHDIISAAFGFGALALYLSDAGRTSFTLRSVVSGLLVALTLDVHMNGVIYIPLIGLLYLLDYKQLLLKTPRFWGYVLGVALGIGYFIAIHILPNPKTYFELFSLGNGTGRTPPLLDAGALFESFVSTLDRLGIITVLLVVLAFVSLLRKPSAADWRVMIIFAMLLAEFAFLIRGKPLFYLIMIYPSAGLIIGALFHRLLLEPWRGSPLLMGRMVCAAALSVTLLVLPPVVFLGSDTSGDYRAASAAVAQAIKPGSTLIGPQTYWFAVPNDNYLSWEQLIYYRRYKPGSTLADAFSALHPDYLILDDFLEAALVDESSSQAADQPFLSLPKQAMESFLIEHAKLVSSSKAGIFGTIRIYKINWNGTGLIPQGRHAATPAHVSIQNIRLHLFTVGGAGQKEGVS